jgi:aminopeptidase N
MAYDTDPFNRWDAAQQLVSQVILAQVKCYQKQQTMSLTGELAEGLIHAFKKILKQNNLDNALISRALSLPSETTLQEKCNPPDIDAIHFAREFVRFALAKELQAVFTQIHQKYNQPIAYQFNADAVGQRQLKNTCLYYLYALQTAEMTQLCMQQFKQSNNMTEQMAALRLLTETQGKECNEALTLFEQQWKNDTLVMDKWFSIQALAARKDTLNVVKQLIQHSLFTIKNPNKVRALIGAFSQNSWCFHEKLGTGYQFIADQVINLDKLNPQIAARLVKVFSRWKQFDIQRQNLMQTQLQRIKNIPTISTDVYEIVDKSLL